MSYEPYLSPAARQRYAKPLGQPQGIESSFAFVIDEKHGNVMHLVDRSGARAADHIVLWTRSFALTEDRDEVLSRAATNELDLVFLCRVAAIFGTAEIDRVIDDIVREAEADRVAAQRRAADNARLHQIVNLYRTQDKHGRHLLELRRASDDSAEWEVRYDRASERDRLCDWLRWQQDNYLEYLGYAAEHGSEALTRRLIDEMFAVERRVKQEGRGAGGLRPLRMWRGER